MSLVEFHFLRPWWFVALIPLLWLAWRLLQRAQSGDSAWHKVVDPALQGQLLRDEHQRRSRWPLAGVCLAWLLSVLALAGPVWERQKTPVYRTVAQRVLVLDLSLSMNAGDVRPSRIERARQKLNDILDESAEAQTGLVVFSAVPYVVTPLTDDVETVRAMLPALSTSLVPAQGSRASLALLEAQRLLDSAASRDGSIWLLTDSAPDPQTDAAVAKIVEAGYQLSVLGFGTEQGAPIPDGNGGFVKDRDGNIVVPSLPQTQLRKLASDGAGSYSTVTTDSADIRRLLGNFSLPGDLATSEEQQLGEIWIERGPWILLLVLPLAALGFRRGWLS